MLLSKVLHVISVIAGLVRVAMSAIAVLFWPAGIGWIGITIHHTKLESRGGIG